MSGAVNSPMRTITMALLFCLVSPMASATEFVLVMPEADEAAATARAEALRWAIRQAHIRYGGQELPAVSVSLGVALFPHHGASSDDLLKAVGLALYQAKQSGRDPG